MGCRGNDGRVQMVLGVAWGLHGIVFYLVGIG